MSQSQEQDVPEKDNAPASCSSSHTRAMGHSGPPGDEEKEHVDNDNGSFRISSTPTEADEEGPVEPEQTNDLEALQTRTSSQELYSVFSKRKRKFIIFMSACGGFFSPFSATIYFPALNAVSKDLNVSPALVNLTLTSYMIFQGIAPMLLGSFSDASGRRPAYFIGFIIYIGACIGIALQNSFVGLFILRCVQSTGSSGFVALTAAVAADVSTSGERGKYMGWVTTGMLVGPAVGPVIGGLLSEYLGWRAIFWFLCILAAVYLIPFLLVYPETCREIVSNGSIPPQRWNVSIFSYLATRHAAQNQQNTLENTTSTTSDRSARQRLPKKRKLRFPNPLPTLRVIFEKDMCLLLFYNSLLYCAFYDIVASMPYLLKMIYNYDDLQIGLCFIPYGIGGFVAPVINGKLLDYNFQRVAKQEGITVDKKHGNSMANFPLEKARIPLVFPLVFVGLACYVAYGWAMEAEAHVAVPLVLTFLIGVTITGAFNILSVLLVDNYPSSPASATAANNFVRCLMGAGATAVVIYQISAMGRGWCFTFNAAVVLATTPALYLLMRKGPKWRAERLKKAERRGASQSSS